MSNRKWYWLGLILFVPLFFFPGACKKDIGVVDFNLNYQSYFSVPSTVGVNSPVIIPTPDIATNSTQEFKNQGIDANKIHEIRIKVLSLTVSDPPGKTFSFLKSVHIYIVSPSLPEIEIAYQENIPTDATAINLVSTNAELMEYIKGSTFKLRARFVTREALLQNVTLKADMQLAGKASVL